MPHELLGEFLQREGWVEKGLLREIPSLVMHVHVQITRRCNVVPVVMPDVLLEDEHPYVQYREKAEGGKLLTGGLSTPMAKTLADIAFRFPDYKPPLLSSLEWCNGTPLRYHWYDFDNRASIETCYDFFSL